MTLRALQASLLLAAGVATAVPASAQEPVPPLVAPSQAPDGGGRTEPAGAPLAADIAGLRRDTWRAAGITIGALVLDGAVTATWKTTACKLCGSNEFDESVRRALAWSNPGGAGSASDVIAKVIIPVLAGGDAYRSARSWGDAGRDVLVVAEAVSISNLATDAAKIGFARRRPSAPATGGGSAAYHSLWSGHTALAFTIVSAQAMQDTIRGDEAAPWVWAIGLTLASAVGYLRVASDAHWATDVLAGAAVGTSIGIAVPLLETRLVRGVTIAPAPGGVVVHF